MTGHWTEAYLGRRWQEGVYDCADLVRDVARDRLGLEIALPSEREWRRMPSGRIAELGAAWAIPTISPSEHDVVLMRVRGSRRSLGSHIGVYAAVDGAGIGKRCPWVLHCLAGPGVIFHPLTPARLAQVHLELVGYYRWT